LSDSDRGFFPARVLRSFVKHPVTGKNISIQAIGLSLYEEVPGIPEEKLGKEVVRTQWLGPESRVLLGRRVLIIVSVSYLPQVKGLRNSLG